MNRLQESVVWKKKYRHDDYLEEKMLLFKLDKF